MGPKPPPFNAESDGISYVTIRLAVLEIIGDKVFSVGILYRFRFQISWKSDHFWPKFTNKKPFLLSKKFLNFFLSNRMPKVVICTMPFPEKKYGARIQFYYIRWLELSVSCATGKIEQFYEISAKICQNLAEKISKKISIINEPIFT